MGTRLDRAILMYLLMIMVMILISLGTFGCKGLVVQTTPGIRYCAEGLVTYHKDGGEQKQKVTKCSSDPADILPPGAQP